MTFTDWLAIGILVGTALPTSAVAAPRLHCQIDQGNITRQLEFAPMADPYTVTSVNINDRFNFKAVVIGDERQVAYIKLYTYYQTPQQPVLLHEAKYVAPVARPDAAPASLTGVHYLYSPDLGRELQFGCALVEVAP